MDHLGMTHDGDRVQLPYKWLNSIKFMDLLYIDITWYNKLVQFFFHQQALLGAASNTGCVWRWWIWKLIIGFTKSSLLCNNNISKLIYTLSTFDFRYLWYVPYCWFIYMCCSLLIAPNSWWFILLCLEPATSRGQNTEIGNAGSFCRRMVWAQILYIGNAGDTERSRNHTGKRGRVFCMFKKNLIYRKCILDERWQPIPYAPYME